jgi:hypothetical protein
MKKFLWVISAGGLLGAVLFAWFSPYIIVWYFTPPAGMGISCEGPVAWAINTYRKVMFTGVLLGVIVATISYFAFGKKGTSPAQGVPPNTAAGV